MICSSALGWSTGSALASGRIRCKNSAIRQYHYTATPASMVRHLERLLRMTNDLKTACYCLKSPERSPPRVCLWRRSVALPRMIKRHSMPHNDHRTNGAKAWRLLLPGVAALTQRKRRPQTRSATILPSHKSTIRLISFLLKEKNPLPP